MYKVKKVLKKTQDSICDKEITEEIKSKCNNLKTQFQHTSLAIAVVNKDIVVQYTNSRFINMFAIKNESVLGKKLGSSLGCIEAIDNICGEDKECRGCLILESIQKVFKLEIPILDIEKSYKLIQNDKIICRNLKFNLIPINLSGDIKVVVYIDDITEQKQSRANLKMFQLLSEKARDIILVVNMGGKIIEANEAAIKAYGYKREELLSKTIYELRIDRGLTETQLHEAFSQGISFECMHHRKDGSSFPVEVSTQSAILDEQKVVISIIRDITERKKSEELLKESESKFRLLFMNMLNGFAYHEIVLDEKGKPIDYIFLDVNGAFERLIGKNRKEIIGRRASDLFNNIKLQDFDRISIFGEVALTGKTMSFKEVHSLTDERWLNITVYSYERGKFATIYHDITEQKQIELETRRAMEAAKAVYKAKSEFLANMSHEIKTPLNGIIGMIDLTLLSELSSDQMDNLSTAKTCAYSLLKIINDILDFSKLEARKLAIDRVVFDLKVLMERIVRPHYYHAKEKGVELTYQLPVDLPYFLIGDPYRVQQVLNNLLSNAVKFTDRGYVSLTIKTISQKDNYITLQFLIRDTGIGISNEDMNKLFKRFSQIDGSQTRRFGGTGLGLVISRQLIEMMGGTINVESEKGKGSLFYFTLRFEIEENSLNSINKMEVDSQRLSNNDLIHLGGDNKLNQQTMDQSKNKSYAQEIKLAIEDILDSIEKLQHILKGDNMQEAEQIAHFIKVLAASVAADKIRTFAFRIELAIRRENQQEALELSYELKKVTDKYIARMEGL